MRKLGCVAVLLLGVVGCRGGSTDHRFAAATSRAAVTAVLVKDINPGPASSSPREMASVVGTAFFAADDGVHGEELSKSDGTEEGTVLVKDINPGPASSRPTYTTESNQNAFFRADDGTTFAGELWKSDGTEEGTALVRALNPGRGSYPSDLTDVNGTLFFRASTVAGQFGLWRTDGTKEGTTSVTHANSVRIMVNVSGALFFSRRIDIAGPHQLVKTDGTTTVILREFCRGNCYVNASFAAIDCMLFFSAKTMDVPFGSDLWKSDGTPEGTVLVRDFGRIETGDAGPDWLTNVAGTLFFSGGDDIHGRELWKSDGTEDGTMLVADIRPGAEGSNPSNLTNVNGTLFFTADDGVHGQELWKSDGTEAGTVLVQDILPGPGSSAPAALTDVAGRLYFTADDGDHGREPWTSDGTEAGTVLLLDIYEGPTSSNPSSLTAVGDTLFFAADDGVHGRELWRSSLLK